jgi:hypothetical protein
LSGPLRSCAIPPSTSGLSGRTPATRNAEYLVEELIEAVTIHADRLEVIVGDPPLLITPAEVGLHDPDMGSVVSEGDLNSGSEDDC